MPELLTDSATPAARLEELVRSAEKLRVYLLEPWSFIPYYIARIATSLRESGVDVHLFSARYHLERSYFRTAGVHREGGLLDIGGGIGHPAMRRVVKSGEYLANLTQIGMRCLVSRPDIVHVQYLPFLDRGFSFEIGFLKSIRRMGIPIVYTIHNVTYQDSPAHYRPIYRRAYEMADRLICHGEDARTELVRDFGIPAERISVIPHGPLFEEKPRQTTREAKQQLGLPPDDTMVLSLGVISEYKGVPFLLDAWKRLAESGVKGRLVVAGTGNPQLLNGIREKTRALGLESSVDLWLEFVPVEKLPLLYQAADVLVYPYKAGTTSGALLTGLNYGKAIVATQLPFFREYLRDGENALLVDYGDVGALAGSLKTLLLQPEVRARLGGALNQGSGEKVSWREIASATSECYRRAISDRRTSASRGT